MLPCLLNVTTDENDIPNNPSHQGRQLMTHAHGKKSVIVAVALSGLVCPGAGQIYYRRYIRGAALVAASLGVVAAVFYITLTAMQDIIVTAPPGEALSDVSGVARMVMAQNSQFFTTLTYIFTALWVYGIIDAIVAPRIRTDDSGA